MDFVTSRLENGRYFRVLTLMDQYSRECLALGPAFSMTGVKVAVCLDAVAADRGLPKSIRVDNGTEFQSRAMDAWAYYNGVKLDFIRPGKSVENGLIESFNEDSGTNAWKCICSAQSRTRRRNWWLGRSITIRTGRMDL